MKPIFLRCTEAVHRSAGATDESDVRRNGHIEFFCVNSGPEAHYIYPNGDEVSNFEIVYLCRKWHGELKRQ